MFTKWSILVICYVSQAPCLSICCSLLSLSLALGWAESCKSCGRFCLRQQSSKKHVNVFWWHHDLLWDWPFGPGERLQFHAISCNFWMCTKMSEDCDQEPLRPAMLVAALSLRALKEESCSEILVQAQLIWQPGKRWRDDFGWYCSTRKSFTVSKQHQLENSSWRSVTRVA